MQKQKKANPQLTIYIYSYTTLRSTKLFSQTIHFCCLDHRHVRAKVSRKRSSNAMSIVELLVHMDCNGCEDRIRRAISKIEGVDSLEIDMEKQKVTVTGYVEERKVLKVVRGTGRKAELWPFPYDSEYYPYASQYYDESTYSSTYNYYRHGFNESVRGYFPDPLYSTVSDNTVHLFSEDNVHAYCSVM